MTRIISTAWELTIVRKLPKVKKVVGNSSEKPTMKRTSVNTTA